MLGLSSMPAHRSHPFIVALLCLALLVRIAVPAGFMPDVAALQRGVYKITICTGYGYKEIMVDENQEPVEETVKKETGHQSSKTIGTLCPFAAIHGAALPVVLLVLALAIFWRDLLFRRRSNPLRSMTAPSAWPRGPPALI